MVLLPFFQTVWQVVEFVVHGRASAAVETEASAVATARMVTRDLIMVIGRFQLLSRTDAGRRLPGRG
jgi:hypothetical protein